jgi:hypothetical protein
MTRARGQRSRSLIEREFPYQVLCPAENVQGHKLDLVILFHNQIGQKMHSRLLFIRDHWHTMYQFADPAHARAFQTLFGGELKEAAK